MLAAIDQFGQTIVWARCALEQINRVRYGSCWNASVVSIYRAELLFLHAEEYEAVAQLDDHCQQADILYRLLNESNELFTSQESRHYEDIEIMNNNIREEIDQLQQQIADSEDNRTRPEAHSAAVFWTAKYRLHCKLSQLIDPLYGPNRLVGGRPNMELLNMNEVLIDVAERSIYVLTFQKSAGKACPPQLRRIYELTMDLAMVVARLYKAQYAQGFGEDGGDANYKARCFQALSQRVTELKKWLDWRQQLVDTLPYIADHRGVLEATIELGTQRLDQVGKSILDSALVTAGEGWAVTSRDAQNGLFVLSLLPRAEHFYLAQYYSDQYTTALRHEAESRYHSKLAEYWGAAQSAMKDYLSECQTALQPIELRLAGTNVELWNLQAGYDPLNRATQYDRYAVAMCEDAITYHCNAQRIEQRLRESQNRRSQITEVLREAALAWERAAQLLLDAAEESAREAAEGKYYFGRRSPDAHVAKWAQLAELLERYAAAVAATKQRSGVNDYQVDEGEMKKLSEQIDSLREECGSSEL